jgi:hypothetical protein
MGLENHGVLYYDERMHSHKFQMEGSTWACWGHDDACGLRAPACFTPKEDAVTRKGLIDLVLSGSI